MELPSLVRSRLGEEAVEAAVRLGEEDLVCFTPTRTLVYRGEGLLSDEGIEVYGHDVERLEVSEGRRKTKFTLQYVDGADAFSVPSDRAEAVLERLAEGVLTTAGVLDEAEAVTGVFRFSELSLVVTEGRLVKHVGAPVWDEDFEEFPYVDVTGLSFEEGSVATQVVLEVAGRPQRIKAPNDAAGRLRGALQEALFAFHEVDSLAALNEAVATEAADDSDDDAAQSLGLEDDISPLVGDDRTDGTPDRADTRPAGDRSRAGTGGASDAADDRGEVAGRLTEEALPSDTEAQAKETAADSPDAEPTAGADATAAAETDTDVQAGGDAADGVDPEAFADLQEQVSLLTRAVQRQNEILERQRDAVDEQREAVAEQGETIQRLIEELRQGR